MIRPTRKQKNSLTQSIASKLTHRPRNVLVLFSRIDIRALARMAYLRIPHLGAPSSPGLSSGPNPGSREAEIGIENLLENLGSRKEFYSLRYRPPGTEPPSSATVGFRGDETGPAFLTFRGFRFTGSQLFVRNMFNPDTPYQRLLIDWQTGTGKSIAVIGLSHEFVRQFRLLAAATSGLRSASRAASSGTEGPTVFIVGFTRSIIMEDMLKYPELGFISVVEVEERRRLRIAAELAGPTSQEAKHLSGFNGVLRRRITDRTRGGYYQFYGYKEFANRLFQVTRQGAARGFDIQLLYQRSLKEDAPLFGELLAQEIRKGNVIINEELLESMRGGLLIADEIHNTYNMQAKNNYGVAVQYVLDALGDEAPRAVFMSATPMSGSAEEIVDLGNLVIPRSALPGGIPLRRADFFAPRGSGRSTGGAVQEGPSLAPDGELLIQDEEEDADPSMLMAADSLTADIVDASTLVSEGVSALSDIGFAAEAADEEAEETASEVPVSQLLPGALEQIGHLMAGRVSFLLDTDVTAYPRKEFIGERLPDISYLQFVQCPMSELHEKTLDAALSMPVANDSGEVAEIRRTIPTNAATLYDMVYPNPAYTVEQLESGNALGLYISGDTPAKVQAAPQTWKDAVGITVLKGAEAGLPSGTSLITGPFLRLPTLGVYSGKYAELVKRVLDVIRCGPGKIMIYHHRVRMSGVLQIQEALRMNGFIDELSNPTDKTICSICGIERGGHGPPNQAGHKFMPARFVVMHSDIDRTAMERSANRYNSLANLNGELFRVLIGSKIIREGANFKAVNHQFILSLPTDIPTLIQVEGRVVRKDSHAELPPDRQFVQIAILISVRKTGEIAPEVRRYTDKMREYLVIQEVDRAIRRYAIDGFSNYGRLTSADASLSERATLESLPYKPVVMTITAPISLATFEAYGHGDREVTTITGILRVLFRARPVWKHEDLWEAVRAGTVRGVAFDPALFSEGNFALALREIAKPWGAPPVGVIYAHPFYILSPVGKTGKPTADIESFIRAPPGGVSPTPPAIVRIHVKDFLQGKGEDKRFAALLRELEAQYLRPSSPNSPEAALLDIGASVHYSLLKRIVEGAAGVVLFEPFKTFLDREGATMLAMYLRYRVIVTADMILRNPEAVSVYRGAPQQLQTLPPETPVGFVTPRSVRVLAQLPGGGEWQDIPHTAIGFGKRFRENNIVVGFVDSESGSASSTTLAKFKIRPPLHRLREKGGRDIRSLSRGAVCETRSREELTTLLALALAAKGTQQKPSVRSASDVCRMLKSTLLELEAVSRGLAGGMMDGLRWCYVFNDRLPSLTAAMTPQ
jgi:hypothetical protein